MSSTKRRVSETNRIKTDIFVMPKDIIIIFYVNNLLEDVIGKEVERKFVG